MYMFDEPESSVNQRKMLKVERKRIYLLIYVYSVAISMVFEGKAKVTKFS